MHNKQTVLVFSGPSWQVFRYLALLARYCGNVKVGRLSRGAVEESDAKENP